MKHAIQIHSLSKKFGNIKAVDSVSLAVKHNTIFGLVGPDGAGKTTIMRMLCSLMEPDRGSAEIGGLDIITDSDEIIKHIGYMPQKFSLYGDLTVIENLEFYSDIYQVPHKVRKEKIQYLLEFSNLKNHSYKLADQLSGGMKQKLALSCNLIHTPEYLFLDEPTIGVDPVARKELWKILFNLKDQGVTIFVSTPYMDEAERCDEIGLMNNGRIIAKDTPGNIIGSFQKHIISIYSEDNYKAKDFAFRQEYIEDAYLLGEELHVVVADYEAVRTKMCEDFKSIAVEVRHMEKISPSLEDVFVNIIKSEGNGGGI